MSRRIGGENVKTQQETGTVFYEASQKNVCRWLLKVTKANTQLLATNITMTCSLCSDHAICYACIFSSTFSIVMHHWFVNRIVVRLAVTTACTLYVIYMREQLESVWNCWEHPYSSQHGPNKQLIYDVIRGKYNGMICKHPQTVPEFFVINKYNKPSFT